MNNNVTMSDIAKKIGVSTVTVSKAIGGKDGVGDELRQKILQCAEDMGYQYTRGAKDDAQEKQYSIGVLIVEQFVAGDSFYTRLYNRLVMLLTDKGHYAMLEKVSAEQEANNTLPSILANKRVDGIIIFGQMRLGYIDFLKTCNIPIMLFDFYNDECKEDCVISDGVFGSCALTKYLIAKGHKEIGYVGNYRKTSSIMDRYIGYYKAMLENELPIHNDWIVMDRNENGEYIDFVLPDKLPTAFVCNCDEVAYNLIVKLKQMNVRVPEDVSIVGFDNDYHATFSTPTITSFGVNLDKMVEKVTNAILKKIKNPSYSCGRIVISGEIYERDSVTVRN